MDDWEVVSIALGWGYFIAWSASFYPQAILNARRKSVDGLALEYQMYNFAGFLFYTIYNCVGFFMQRKSDYTGSVSVQVNDVAFAVHALVLTTITCLQCILYRLPSHTISRSHYLICLFLWFSAFLMILLAAFGVLPWYASGSSGFTAVAYLGYLKTFISFIKYMPQAYLNYCNRSTVGWSIGNILLDFTGGILSFAQEFVDAYRQNDWTLFSHNVPKLLLALLSISFDLLFMTQHYILYPSRTDPHLDFSQQQGQPYTKLQTDPDLPKHKSQRSYKVSAVDQRDMQEHEAKLL
eukprot:gb/GEZN01014395.1/.p1 GENE.gb/GEZN01014395.1/~~gb/GEZN01014395.1/.p1  ORF type:complete len:294 (-),score=36.86 gb/GEZN01014395.1/:36-917(-)